MSTEYRLLYTTRNTLKQTNRKHATIYGVLFKNCPMNLFKNLVEFELKQEIQTLEIGIRNLHMRIISAIINLIALYVPSFLKNMA